MHRYNTAVKVWLHADGSRSGSIVHSPDPHIVKPHAIDTLPGESLVIRCHRGVDCPVLLAAAEAVRSARDTDNRRRSVRRSVTLLQSYVRGHNLTRLLTFTNGAESGWESGSDALDDFMAWLKDGGRHLLHNAPLVAVAERGGTHGRWHIHAAITPGRFLDYNGIREAWTDFLISRGYTSTSRYHRWHAGDENGKHKQGFTSARHAAIYLAKYLRKGLAESVPTGRHRYRTLNATAPTPLTFRTDSITTALVALGVREAGCYRLEYADAATGELHLYGVLFDSGG